MPRKGKRKPQKEALEDTEEDPQQDRLTAREAGMGLIVLGSILILIAIIMPFVLGTTDQMIWGLGRQVLAFVVLGLVSIGLGALLMNFRRLSRKL